MMKIKKKIAAGLAFALCLNPLSIYANSQSPVTKIEPAIVSYDKEAGPSLPYVKINFTQAVNSAEEGTTNDKTEGYIVKYENANNKNVNNVNKVFESKDIPATQSSITLGESGTLVDDTSLTSGQLYKYWVQAYHTHIVGYDSNNNPIKKRVFSSENDSAMGYFVTEFNTQARTIKDSETNETKIQIITEYIPGATYDIYYENSKVQDYKNIKQLLQKVSADLYYDAQEGKVVYTFDNPSPGTEYSFYVKVSDIQGNFISTNLGQVANIDTASGGNNKTTTPKVVYAKTPTGVEINEVGKNYIQFRSEFSEAFYTKLSKVQIIELSSSNQETIIGEIDSKQFQKDEARDMYVMNFTYNKPTQTTNFLVVFHFKDGTVIGNTLNDMITYTPTDSLSVPMRPQVPEASNEKVIQLINDSELSNYRDYFLKDDAVLDNIKTSAITLGDTFHSNLDNGSLGIQFIWSAQRKSGDIEEDKEIAYDIWIFKDKIPTDYQVYTPIKRTGTQTRILNSAGSTIGFKQTLSNYIDEEKGEVKLVSNSTYYIAVRARNIKKSDLVSEATVVAITIDKQGEIATPSVLGKPPLRVQEENVTSHTIPIEWQTEWYEVKSNDLTAYNELSEAEQEMAKYWNSWAYLSETLPYLRWTGESENKLAPLSEKQLREKLGASFDEDYTGRTISLGKGIKYEVKAVSYDEVMEEVAKRSNLEKQEYMTDSGALRVEAWINDYESKSQEDADFMTGWKDITPSQKESDKSWWEHSVSQYYSYSEAGSKNLEPNKRYIIMVRTYREVDMGTEVVKLYQAFPSYVVGITKTDFKPVPPVPNAPVLRGDKVTSNSVTVKWQYNYDFEYELRYSKLEDPETAQVWKFDVSQIAGETGYVANGGDLYVTITGLSPETKYNIWIRAIQKNTTPVQYSNWSNGITLKTDTIPTPPAPTGLGAASLATLLELGKDSKAIGSDYLIVEWSKVDEDVENTDSNIQYSYQAEFADNSSFLDAIVVDTVNGGNGKGGFEILDKNVIQFKGLVSNRDYYVKVKTVLTYTDPDSKKVIIKESSYTTVVRLKTLTSNNEYDGGANDHIVIYPNPIEESYQNGIWTYEIVDAAKVTTQIQESKQYFYTVTLEKYKNQYDATVRRIIMPKKVLDTLINQGMALKVVTNIAVYEIPGKALKYYSNQYSASDIVQFDFTKMGYSDVVSYVRSYPEQYVKGEKFEVSIKGAEKSVAVTKLDDYMKIRLKLDVQGAYNYMNYFTYQYNYASGSWSKFNYEVDVTDNHYLIYSSIYTGLNALYQRSVATDSSSSYAMNELANAYNIKGLGTTYGKYASVGASQYVSLLLGMRLNRSEINLMSSSTADDYAKAKAAGLYVSSNRGYVTREQALAGVVKLYEISNGYQIKPSSVTFNHVSSNYREAASKAYAVGLIDSMPNPQGTVNYGELCDWLIQIS